VPVSSHDKLGRLCKEGHLVQKWWGWQRWGTIWDGVASIRIVRVSAFIFTLHQKTQKMASKTIVQYHPMGAPTCLCKQEVGKPNQNATQLCVKAHGYVNDDLRTDGL